MKFRRTRSVPKSWKDSIGREMTWFGSWVITIVSDIEIYDFQSIWYLQIRTSPSLLPVAKSFDSRSGENAIDVTKGKNYLNGGRLDFL